MNSHTRFTIPFKKNPKYIRKDIFIIASGLISVNMSTGKRLAKRSIIGTRVCAPGDNGKYYSGVIHAVKTPASFADNNNCINLTSNTRYSVRFDSKCAVGKRGCREYRECDLIGPGFGSINGLVLTEGQKVFITFNGRETSGEVLRHAPEIDEVTILINLQEVNIALFH